MIWIGVVAAVAVLLAGVAVVVWGEWPETIVGGLLAAVGLVCLVCLVVSS